MFYFKTIENFSMLLYWANKNQQRVKCEKQKSELKGSLTCAIEPEFYFQYQNKHTQPGSMCAWWNQVSEGNGKGRKYRREHSAVMLLRSESTQLFRQWWVTDDNISWWMWTENTQGPESDIKVLCHIRILRKKIWNHFFFKCFTFLYVSS